MATEPGALASQRRNVQIVRRSAVRDLQVSAQNEARFGRILFEVDTWQDRRHTVYSQERSRIAYAAARAGYACIYGESHGD